MSSNIELSSYNKRVMDTLTLMLEHWLENNPDKNNFEIYIKNLNLTVEIKTNINDDLKFNTDIVTFKNK